MNSNITINLFYYQPINNLKINAFNGNISNLKNSDSSRIRTITDGCCCILCNLPKRYMIQNETTHVVLLPLTMYWRIPGHKYIMMDLHTVTIKVTLLEARRWVGAHTEEKTSPFRGLVASLQFIGLDVTRCCQVCTVGGTWASLQNHHLRSHHGSHGI